MHNVSGCSVCRTVRMRVHVLPPDLEEGFWLLFLPAWSFCSTSLLLSGSGTLPPAAWLQPFFPKQRAWFCAAILLRAWGYMPACAWWLPLAAVPGLAVD